MEREARLILDHAGPTPGGVPRPRKHHPRTWRPSNGMELELPRREFAAKPPSFEQVRPMILLHTNVVTELLPASESVVVAWTTSDQADMGMDLIEPQATE